MKYSVTNLIRCYVQACQIRVWWQNLSYICVVTKVQNIRKLLGLVKMKIAYLCQYRWITE
jgi:hypothetical protein